MSMGSTTFTALHKLPCFFALLLVRKSSFLDPSGFSCTQNILAEERELQVAFFTKAKVLDYAYTIHVTTLINLPLSPM